MSIKKLSPELQELAKEISTAMRDPNKMSKRVNEMFSKPLIQPGKFRNTPVERK
jgi:uncharacterized coiled-coil DUF342 family protein